MDFVTFLTLLASIITIYEFIKGIYRHFTFRK